MKSFSEFLSESLKFNKALLGMPAVRSIMTRSKVLTPEGLPRTVFHGTSAAKDFRKFGITRDFGFHFAEDPKLAERALRSRLGGTTQKGGPRIIPAFLDIKNPAPFDEITKEDNFEAPGAWLFSDVVRKMADRGVFSVNPERNQFEMDPSDASYRGVSLRGENIPGYGKLVPAKRKVGKIDVDTGSYIRDTTEKAKEQAGGSSKFFKLPTIERNKILLKHLVGDLRGLGYDGGEYENKFEGKGKTWVAFDPQQVVSAITGKTMGSK